MSAITSKRICSSGHVAPVSSVQIVLGRLLERQGNRYPPHVYAASRDIGAFFAVCCQILTGWRSQVLRKRQPVSRDTMRRFYYLRIHQPENYSDVELAVTNVLQFYWYRRKARARASSGST